MSGYSVAALAFLDRVSPSAAAHIAVVIVADDVAAIAVDTDSNVDCSECYVSREYEQSCLSSCSRGSNESPRRWSRDDLKN